MTLSTYKMQIKLRNECNQLVFERKKVTGLKKI